MSDYKSLDLHVSDSLAQIHLRYEPFNILDFGSMAELSDALDRASTHPFLILCSSLKNFSLGVDIAIHTPEKAPQMLEVFHDLIRKLYRYSGISACFLHGHALGGGLEMALLCDLIFAHKETKLGFPEIRLACFPPVAAVLLPRMIGRYANAIVLLGDSITASEGQKIGLIDNVYDNEEEFRNNFVQKVLAYSSDSMRVAKKVLRDASSFDFEQELKKAEKAYLHDLLQNPDVTEGIQAFLEKRPPKYRKP